MARRSSKRDALSVPINSTATNQIPTKELLLRLQKIADTLSAVDQNDASSEEYQQLATDLSSKKLFQNKNLGIQAYTCCALTDILRIFAPDAPFPPEVLSQIFRAFLKQLSHTWNEENAYFQQQCYILKRIVEVRSIVLIADLPDAEKLIEEMFQTMYSLAGKGFPSKLEPLAAEMLAETVSEADFVPRSVVSLVLKKLVVPVNYPVAGEASHMSNTAFFFSLSVCEANVDKMARVVAQHFSEMLDASVTYNSKGDNDTEASYDALERIHSSSVHIWTHLPELLSSVMGLISDELNSDNERIRLLATTSIGSMLASTSPTSSGSSTNRFISSHQTAWTNWLGKASDISTIIRSSWVQQVVPIISTQTMTTDELKKLCGSLSKCLLDSNEKVRLSACQAFRALPMPLYMNKLASEESLQALLVLCREKHVDIRNEAINFLAELYNYFLERTLQGKVIDYGSLDKAEMSKVEDLITLSIPNTIIHLNYVNDKLLTATADVVLFEQLVPFNDDPLVRVSRFCLLYLSLDARSKAAITAINNRQKKNVEVLLKFVDLAEEYALDSSLQQENKENKAEKKAGNDNHGKSFQNTKLHRDQLFASVEKIIQWLTTSFPSGIHSYECIDRLFRLKNLRLISLLKNSIYCQLDYKSVKNSIKELLLKVAEEKTIKVDGESVRVSVSDMISNLKLLLYRSAFIFYNKSNIGQLIEFCTDEESRFNVVANEIVSNISNTFPAGFRAHAKTLAQVIVDEPKESKSETLLRTLYHFGNRFPENVPRDDTFLDLLTKLATSGNPKQAKYAVKLLLCVGANAKLDAICKATLPFSNITTATHISTVSQLLRCKSVDLTQDWNAISNFVVEQVLRKNDPEIETEDQSNAKNIKNGVWINDEDLALYPSLSKKLYSLALLVNKVRAAEKTSDSPVMEKTVKLLSAIISKNGDIVKNVPTPKLFRSRLLLAAGLSILKLSQIPSVNGFISQAIIWKLARLLRDETLNVRSLCFDSLKKYLSRNSISERFLCLVFLLGHEPDEDLKRSASTWILSQHLKAEAKKNLCFENLLVRLAYGLSHDDLFTRHFVDGSSSDANADADTEVDREDEEIAAYAYVVEYVTMFLNCVAKESNCSLLYYLASRIKQYRCKADDEGKSAENINLYRVAELMQLMIKEYSDDKGWTIQTWPGKINLPIDIFTIIDDFNEALAVISRVYIPDMVQVRLRELLAKPTTNKVKRKPVQKLAHKTAVKKRRRKLSDADVDLIPADNLPRRASSRVRKRVTYQEVEEDSEEASADEESEFEE